MDKEKYKNAMYQYLATCNVYVNRPQNISCILPGHGSADKHPSMKVTSSGFSCFKCSESGDVYDLAGLLHGTSDFKQQFNIVETALKVGGGFTPKEYIEEKPKEMDIKAQGTVNIYLSSIRDNYADKINEFASFRGYSSDFAEYLLWWPGYQTAKNALNYEVLSAAHIYSKSWSNPGIVCRYETGWKLMYIKDGKTKKMASGVSRAFPFPDLTEDNHVMLVEAELCAIACRANLINAVSIGGTSGFKSTDAVRLKGYEKIYICMDGDEAGKKAQAKIYDSLKKAGCKNIKIVSLNPEIGNDPDEYIKSGHVEDLRIAMDYEDEKKDILPFDPLGFDSEAYHYRSGRTGIIHSIGKNQFDKKHLMPIADYWWFVETYGDDDGKVSWDIVANEVMKMAERKGTYSKKNIRGRGVWNDDDKNIIFDGEYIYENGTRYEMLKYKSKFCYERMERIDFFPKSDNFNLRVINSFIRPLKSSHPGQLKYMLGWCAIAPLCGVLNWRPHIWVHGLSGSGKTTVMEDIASQLLKGVSIEATGKSTEAGIRQKIANDARPVIVDDVKKNGADDHVKIEKLLDFMRTTSSDTEATTLMGTAGQKAIERSTKTMFMLSSVSEQADATEDKNRITPIEMIKEGNMTKKNYNKLVRGIKKWMRKGLNKYFIKSVMENMNTIIENIDIFEEVLSEKLHNSRDADQLAPMVAGYFHIMHEGKKATEKEAYDFIEQFDYMDQSARTDIKEHDRMFSQLMIQRVKFHNGEFTEDRTIASLIEDVIRKKEADLANDPWETCGEHTLLRDYGFRYGYGSDHENDLLIAGSHQRIKDELKKINLDKNYSTALKSHRLFNGFTKSIRVTQGDDPKRCLSFDVMKVLGPDADEVFDAVYNCESTDEITF